MQEYEPYIIVARKYVPWYDERFRGRGYDKASHILQMHGASCLMNRQPCFPAEITAFILVQAWA
jgi:hypothetical protein